MKSWVKQLLILVALLIPSLAWSQTTREWDYANGVARPPAVDQDGTRYTTERYPREFKAGSLVILSAAAVTNNSSVTSSTYPSAGIQLYKSLRITTSGNTAAWTLKFKGSYDGINFGYLMDQIPTIAGGTSNVVASDTLKITGSGAVTSVWVPLCYRTGVLFPFSYLQVEVINNGAGGTMTTTLELGGRQY